MKKEDLKVSFDHIKPSESAKKRMLNNILDYSDKKKGIFMPGFSYRKAIPALVLTIVMAGSLLTYNKLTGKNNYASPPEYSAADNAAQGREDAVAPLLNQFQIGDRHYILLPDELRVEYGFPAAVKESDLGEKIADISNSPDKSLIGSEAYRYLPAGGEAVLAVKKDNGYQLFQFFTFESYNNNQDEDSIEYLKLYGIQNADDIAKVQFIGHSEQSKLQGFTDIRGEIRSRDEIARFFSYYSVLKNSSDKYFDRLFNFKGTDSRNKGVDIDAPLPDVAMPTDEVGRDIAVPDKPNRNIAAPDQIGVGEDLPMNVETARPNIAEDLPLAIPEKNEASVVTVDTPTAADAPTVISPSSGMVDMGNSGAGSVEPSQGTAGDALANPITIRIYNQKGVYYDSMYYMNMGFISRYEVSEDFADFMNEYIK